jgi:aldehyde dehydrogenase
VAPGRTSKSWENGKACRETLAADIPLAIDHLRYFAGAIRSQEGNISQIDEDTVAYHFHEPLGVVGQIIPWNFPILMAIWKLAPALAAGNTVVLKPAEQTPASIHVLNELIADLLPPGVLNIVNGFGVEAGKPLASNKRIRKIAFTGETTTGRLIMQYASENLIPVTLELGGKSPNVFFDDVAASNDAFYDKALEGFAMFALNQGEVCTCPSRALIQGGMYTDFLEQAVKRTEQIKQGDPLDTDTMIGAQASNDQFEKILSYIDIGRKEGAKVLTGGDKADLGGDLSGGYYIQPTVFEGHNRMRIFQEEIFGPVVSVTRFSDYDDAMKIANDTLYVLGAAVWSCDGNARRVGRPPGRPDRAGCGEADRVLHVGVAVRVLGRGTGGGAVPHPVPAVHRRGVRGAGRGLTLLIVDEGACAPSRRARPLIAPRRPGWRACAGRARRRRSAPAPGRRAARRDQPRRRASARSAA